MSYSLAKRYVERGVQTDPSIAFKTSFPRETHLSSSFAMSSLAESATVQEDRVQDNLSVTVCPTGAYTRSAVSKTGKSIGLIHSRKERKPPAIRSGYPSTVISSATRAVSLPDIPESPEDNLGSLDRQTRVVSMPECGKLGTLASHNLTSTAQLDNSFSSDISYTSLESSQMPRNHERPCPPDIPRTPSPPSSPESVMIIANEGHVSGSFLRRPHTDEDGWITWASSPPRPIPALHGPLSLPYARCPSGAEGTVMEGDDLSNKIWGLSVDDAQSYSRPSKNQTNPFPLVVDSNPPAVFQAHIFTNDTATGRDNQPVSFQRQRDTVIDLSNPLTFSNRVDASAVSHRNLPAISGYQSSNAVPPVVGNFSTSNQLGDIDLSLINRPEILNNSARRDFAANLGHSVESSTGSLGLGLRWDKSYGSANGLIKGTPKVGMDRIYNRLNTAAPAFIPQGNVARVEGDSTQGAYTAQQYSRPPQQLGRPSAFEIAQNYKARQDYRVSTPPSTASPLWTPIFPQHAGGDLRSNAPQSKNPNVYSPNLDIDEYSIKLAAMIAQLNGHDFGYDIDGYSPMPKLSTHAEMSSSLMNGHGNISQPSIHLLSLPDSLGNHDVQQEAEGEGVNFSSERRRNLSHQHPRSIPLARLIQRRLSSVEEEGNANHGSLLPLLRKQFPSPQIRSASLETPDLQYSSDHMLQISARMDQNVGGKGNGNQSVEATVTKSMKGSPNDLEESKTAVVKLPYYKTSGEEADTALSASKKKAVIADDHGKENNDVTTSGPRKPRVKPKKRPEHAPTIKSSTST